MRALLFPGQGAQFQGMGRELFASQCYPVERADAVDEIVGFPLAACCVEGPADRLKRTEVTQPCLYTVNALSFERFRDAGGVADFYAGHSLGEYDALYAAGVFDFLTGLKLVVERGRLMAAAPKGGMAAVLGCDAERVVSALADAGLDGLDLANFNTPSQLVVSGPVDQIARAESVLKAVGAAQVIVLPVGAAFHSRYMRPAAEQFEDFSRQFTFRAPQRPVIANVSALPYPQEPAQADAVVREYLVKQFSAQVHWAPSIAYLKRQGVTEFIELGPGRTLQRMLAQIPTDLKSASRPDADVATPASPPVAHVAPSQRVHPPPADAGPGEPTSAGATTDGLSSAAQRILAVLGSATFKTTYGTRYAYAAGSMYKGIASVPLVVALAQRRHLGFFGAGGLDRAAIDAALTSIRKQVAEDAPFGVNLLNQDDPELEEATVDLLISHGVRNVEAAAYISPTPALVRYRLTGLGGTPESPEAPRHRVLAKVSRPEVASAFMRPPPATLIAKLLEEGAISPSQAQLGRVTPLADDVCVEADSGGHSDGGVAFALLPTILLQRDRIVAAAHRPLSIRVGAAGGIGTPHAAAAAFLMGAEFVMTGSVNQCSVEAGTSDSVKDLLQSIGPQDTAYAPAGDMFEMGARVQVARKGLFFHVRANRLYELYRHYDSLDALPPSVRQQLEQKYFKRTLDEVWVQTRAYYAQRGHRDADHIEKHPKKKMAAVFKWYFHHTNELALQGQSAHSVDYQIHCGPALGAFNQWVEQGPMTSWRERRVADIAERLMQGTAQLLEERLRRYRIDQDG